MNKQEFIDQVATKTGQTKKDVTAVIDAIFDTDSGVIVTELKKNQKFPIIGFGAFQVKTTKARVGRNPRSGEEINIPAGKKLSFSVGKSLKDSIA